MPVRQVIRIGVAIIEKMVVFKHQSPGVGRIATGPHRLPWDLLPIGAGQRGLLRRGSATRHGLAGSARRVIVPEPELGWIGCDAAIAVPAQVSGSEKFIQRHRQLAELVGWHVHCVPLGASLRQVLFVLR